MPLKILVADDSITIQKIVEMAFENEDVLVEGICNGQEAFEKIADFKPDIVLADVDMPGLNGFKLSQKIKSNPDLTHIKVLLLASDFEDFDEARFKKCQAENHISKPFKSDNIVQMVTKLMEENKVVGSELVFSENTTEEEVELDEEPSLEELLESVEKLSSDSIEDIDLEETNVSIQKKNEIKKDEELVDNKSDKPRQMDQEVELPNELGASQQFKTEENAQGEQSFEDNLEVLSEVQTRELDNLDDLNIAFKEILAGESKQELSLRIGESEISHLGSIVPEPEDLLERMAPSFFSDEEERTHTADEISENMKSMINASSFSAANSKGSSFQETDLMNNDDRIKKVVKDQICQILEESLNTSLQKEGSEMSGIIIKTVREVVREIVPDIARSLIREEIDKIKKSNFFP